MEDLRNRIKDKFDSLGWTSEQEGVWKSVTTVMTNGGTIIINGQRMTQQGQEKTLHNTFEITGNCTIEDNDIQRVDESVMCRWEVKEDDMVVSYLETNIYPGEFDKIELYSNKIFGV